MQIPLWAAIIEDRSLRALWGYRPLTVQSVKRNNHEALVPYPLHIVNIYITRNIKHRFLKQ